MIDFLNPLVLLGLAAAAIPFIIHFLSRFRAERRDFPSLMLLKEVQSRNVRRMKMRQWLLLILRTLIIALLLLAPARPLVKGSFISSGPGDHLPVAAVFIQDVSASTGFVGREGAAASFLAGRMERILGWMNPSDRYRVITAADNFNLCDKTWRSPSRPGAQTASQGEATTTGPGCRATRLGPALKAAEKLLASSAEAAEALEAYIFTDRQRGFLGPDSLDIGNIPDIRWYLADAHREEPGNLSVESVGLPGELVRPGASLKVTVTVAHYGGLEPVQLFPRVYLDSRLVGQGEAVVAPGRKASVVVELPPVEPGAHELTAVIDADGLAVDNRRTVCLRVPERLRVLFVESRSHKPDYLGSALEVLSTGPSPPIRLERRSRPPVTPGEFAGADLLVLYGLSYPSGVLRRSLEGAMARGVPFLIVAEKESKDNPAGIKRFNAVAARLGLPFALGNAEGSGLVGTGYDTPARPGAAEPAATAFVRIFDAIPGLEKLKVFTLRSLPEPGSGPDNLKVWDMETAGEAVLVRLVRGRGFQAAISTTDLASESECELARTPLFVPLLHGLFSLLADKGPLIKPDIEVGGKAVIHFGGRINTSNMVINAPGDRRFFMPPGESERIIFTETREPGFYRLFESGRFLGAFSVGLAPEESDLRLEPEESIVGRFGKEAGLKFIPRDADLGESVLLARGGVEVWPWLLMAVLCLLIVEQLVANRKEEGD